MDHHLNEHIIREDDLESLFQGTPARRYALVNKAIKSGELVRLCRGYYTLHHRYQKEKTLDTFYIANRIVPFSFVSCESALSFHNFIPERILQTNSIAPFGRNKKFETPYGNFIYRVLPILPACFYFGVQMIVLNNHIVYIASPLRALMDYVYCHKIKNANAHFLVESLRIEKKNIDAITKKEITVLRGVYRSRYVTTLLKNLSDKKS